MRLGGRDTVERAREIYEKKLEDYEQPPLDESIRAELEEYVVRRRAELGD
jgi:trimethylamine--corrinoid protein Co-methyltransferase